MRRRTGSCSWRRERAEGELLAEDRGGLGQRQRRGGHQRALARGQDLVDAVAQLVGEGHDVPVAALVVHQDVGVHARDGRVAEGAAVLAGPQPARRSSGPRRSGGRRRPASARSCGRRRARRPWRRATAADVAVLGQRRVAVPVLEPVEAHPAGLEGVVAVGEARVGRADGADQRVDDLVLDLVGEVAGRYRAGVVPPAVLDRLVLGERVGDPGEEPDVLPEHARDRGRGASRRAPVRRGELVESLGARSGPCRRSGKRRPAMVSSNRRTQAARPATCFSCRSSRSRRRAGAGGRRGPRRARAGSGRGGAASTRSARWASSSRFSSRVKNRRWVVMSLTRSCIVWKKRPIAGSSRCRRRTGVGRRSRCGRAVSSSAS